MGKAMGRPGGRELQGASVRSTSGPDDRGQSMYDHEQVTVVAKAQHRTNGLRHFTQE